MQPMYVGLIESERHTSVLSICTYVIGIYDYTIYILYIHTYITVRIGWCFVLLLPSVACKCVWFMTSLLRRSWEHNMLPAAGM